MRRTIFIAIILVGLFGSLPQMALAGTGQWHIPVPTTHVGTTASGVVIDATLTEYRIALDPARPTIHAGERVRFVIENKGKLAHEFMITSTAMAAMQMNMKQMDAMSLATVEPNRLPPGATVTLNVVFKEPGTYEIACHLPGHEAMKTTITVLP